MRINELTQAEQIVESDMLALDNEFGTKSIKFAKILEAMNQNVKIEESVSDEFSTETAYQVGDYCIKENRLFKFTEAKEAGPWDSSKVIPCTVSSEMLSLSQDIVRLNERVQTGIVKLNVPGNINGRVIVTFDKPYKTPPVVVACMVSTEEYPSVWGYYAIAVVELTINGCSIAIHSLDEITRDIRVCWIAIGK